MAKFRDQQGQSSAAGIGIGQRLGRLARRDGAMARGALFRAFVRVIFCVIFRDGHCR
jgi:hypothetical protein